MKRKNKGMECFGRQQPRKAKSVFMKGSFAMINFMEGGNLPIFMRILILRGLSILIT